MTRGFHTNELAASIQSSCASTLAISEGSGIAREQRSEEERRQRQTVDT